MIKTTHLSDEPIILSFYVDSKDKVTLFWNIFVAQNDTSTTPYAFISPKQNHLHPISKFRLADRLKVTLPFPTEVPYQGKTRIIRKNPPSNPFDPKGYSQRFASIA